MFIDESLWIRDALERAPLRPGMTVLDVGSSTLEFRTRVQPHIERNVFGPLRSRGLVVTHLDARAEPGVDIVADVATLEGVDGSWDVVICTNLLEHVEDRGETVRNIQRVVKPAGMLVLTVPKRYPIHHDPIDTGFRPSARELRELLGWTDVLVEQDITVQSRAHYAGGRWFRRFLLPWQIACVLARKPAAQSD